MKRLDEIEPRTNLQATPAPAGVDTTNPNYHFIINQPGSYYLTSNLLVTKTNGIQINAEGVTLDLNGFEISRVTPSGYGIEIPFASYRATVRNGTVSKFASGILGSAPAGAFRDLAVTGCTNFGIKTGSGAVLESCRAALNSGTAGIDAGWGATLSNCTAMSNTVTYGINTTSGSTLTNCAAYGNTADFAINVSSGSSLTNCSASFNTGRAPLSAAINAGYGCTLRGCTVYFNDSTAAQSSTTEIGISVSSGCTIQSCTVEFNNGDGIRVGTECQVRENNCVFNFAGVHATGGNNRIEENNVISNGRGIHLDTGGNLIIKNSASDNTTDYSIAANNRYGPIVDISAAGAPAVNGKSAADTTGTSHPWANFSY
jgi:parallel beta-helix repeat protein